MNTNRTNCPVCHKSITVTKFGYIRPHGKPVLNANGSASGCAGSGERPHA